MFSLKKTGESFIRQTVEEGESNLPTWHAHVLLALCCDTASRFAFLTRQGYSGLIVPIGGVDVRMNVGSKR